MFKAIILLARRDDMTHDEFAAWWLGEHAPLAKALAGVRGVRFNLVDTPDAEYDGITELWFDSQADFEAAYATEHGKQVAADSLTHVSRRERLFVTENTLA